MEKSTHLRTRACPPMSLYSLQLAAGIDRSKWSPHCQRCTTSYRTKSACWLVGRKPQSFDWTLSKFSSSVIPMCGCYTSVKHGIRHLVFFWVETADSLRTVSDWSSQAQCLSPWRHPASSALASDVKNLGRSPRPFRGAIPQ